MKKNKGISTVGSLVIILIVLVLLGIGGFYFYQVPNLPLKNPTETDKTLSANACDYLTLDLVEANIITRPLVVNTEMQKKYYSIPTCPYVKEGSKIEAYSHAV